MKKYFMIILLFFIAFLSACTFSETDNVFKINLSNEVKTLYVGDEYILTTNANKMKLEAEVLWSSSNNNIIVVNDGMIVAIGVGSARIEASSGEHVATAYFNVILKPLDPYIEITGGQTVDINKTITLEAEVFNYEGNSEIKWATSNKKLATVSNEGLVTGISSGLVTITASLKNDATIKSEYLVYVRVDLENISTVVNEIINSKYELIGEYDLTLLNTQITNLVKNTKNSVVGVSNYLLEKGKYNLNSIGSGVIYQRNIMGSAYQYRLLTNQHVISKEIGQTNQIKVYLGYLDEELSATVVKSNEKYDLAIVEFVTTHYFEPVPLGTSQDINIGDFVVAIGNPTGYEYFGSVTLGVVSYEDRFDGGNNPHLVQHDAAINPGNSGGPLLSLNGKIIGINTMKLLSLEIDNMGFAVSIITILDFLG